MMKESPKQGFYSGDEYTCSFCDEGASEVIYRNGEPMCEHCHSKDRQLASDMTGLTVYKISAKFYRQYAPQYLREMGYNQEGKYPFPRKI